MGGTKGEGATAPVEISGTSGDGGRWTSSERWTARLRHPPYPVGSPNLARARVVSTTPAAARRRAHVRVNEQVNGAEAPGVPTSTVIT